MVVEFRGWELESCHKAKNMPKLPEPEAEVFEEDVWGPRGGSVVALGTM